MMQIIYSLVVLIATMFGAIAGLGGGVIIKPILDMIGYHDVSTIGVYSCFAVFTMCVVSIMKQVKKGFKIDISTVIYISLGSYLGGGFGDVFFENATSQFNDHKVKLIQSTLLLVTLLFILFYTLNQEKIKSYHMDKPLFIVLLGVFLGTVSIFLGIGGGPLNVSLLVLFFSFDMKQATIYSIATIFFSQLSKLSMIVLSSEFLKYDLSFLPFICLSAIIGGYIGTIFNQALNNKSVKKVYVILIVILICISLYNIQSYLAISNI